MARTTINSLGVPAGTITATDLSYPLTDFSSTGIDDNATSTAITIDSSGNIAVTGTVDGRDLATDGTKLDGIEASATADQTAAEIRTLVDSATDSNVFTDADHTKLNGIETSADVTDATNVTAAGALMDSEVTNLAQVKAFSSSDYATAAQGTKADSALQNVVEDTTPQLGGNLDFNGNTATSFTSTGIDDNASSTVMTIASSGETTFTGDIVISEATPAITLDDADNADGELKIVQSTGSSFYRTRGVSGNGAHVFQRNNGTTNLKIFQTNTSGDVIFYENDGATSGLTWDASASKLTNFTSTGIDDNATTTAITIDSDGDVGIGLASPLFQATDRTAVTINGTTSSNLVFGVGGSANTYFLADSSGFTFGNTSATLPTMFYTNSAERMRIDSSGNVGINQNTPSAKLDVSGTLKLNGSYPVGTTNTVLGETAFNSAQSGASYNVAIGYEAMRDNTTANNNVAVGYQSSHRNTTGAQNVAVGRQALYFNTTGTYNAALGDAALFSNTTASNNTAVGREALLSNTTGAEQVAIGALALEDNTTGTRLTALGYGALRNNTTANSNVAVGYASLGVNTTGADNNALGRGSLGNNTTGGDNNAFGYNALNDNTTGTQNTAMGHASLDHSTTASYNTAFGAIALTDVTTGIGNTAVGRGAAANIVTDSYVTAIGYNALTTNTGHSASYNVAVGGNSQANATSFYNTSVGYRALEDATSHSNTAVGRQCLAESTSGAENAALGNMAMPVSTSAAYSTAVGSQALYSVTSGSYNTAVGRSAAVSLTTGSNNVSIGNNAHNGLTTGQHTTAIGVNAGYNGTSASYNVFVGNYAGRLTTSGSNVSVGYATLYNNTSGSLLTVVGQSALYYNTTGAQNTAVGSAALQTNTTGSYNTAVGLNALLANTTASYGVAVGYQTLDANTTGARNCAVGYVAMSTNTTGNYNTALGSYALFYQTTPNFNVGVGYQSGYNTTTGFDNTYLGTYAGYSGTAAARNVYIGYTAGYNGTGSNNVALGYQAGDAITSGNNLTCLGYQADPSSSTATNEVTLGNSSVATLRCNASLTGLSDERDKKNIETLGGASNFIKALRPVSFDWNMRDGGKVGVSDHGFIAQELKTAQEETNWHVPNLVYESNPDKLEASYATLLPSVVSALQEALVEIETLKAELSALKGD